MGLDEGPYTLRAGGTGEEIINANLKRCVYKTSELWDNEEQPPRDAVLRN